MLNDTSLTSALVPDIHKCLLYITLLFYRCPKTVENFTVHCKNGYYNQNIFHRVIKGFMVQTGDPEGMYNSFKTFAKQ